MVFEQMKVIVISGTHSDNEKTVFAREVLSLVPGSVFIKIGHGPKKSEAENGFYQCGTPFSEIVKEHRGMEYLILESESVQKDIEPVLTLYITGADKNGPAGFAGNRADIVSGTVLNTHAVRVFSEKSGLPEETIKRIIWLAGARLEEVTAVILAGGKSIRMGRDKAGLEISGTTLLDRIFCALSGNFDEIILNTSAGSSLAVNGVRSVQDHYPNCGPLGGIYSGLDAASHDLVFIVACDIPDINIGLVRKLLSFSENYDIVIPSFVEGRSEPLYSIYRKSVLGPAAELLEGGKLRIAELFGKVRTKVLLVENTGWYVNLNTPEDYNTYIEKTERTGG
jgi:molybdopterin-guanine dinucleotide biosynthesis protein A